MRKLYILLLLLLSSNCITKAWCVLCVRENTALQLLNEEANHTIYQDNNYGNWRTMLEDITVTYINTAVGDVKRTLSKNETYYFQVMVDYQTNTAYYIIRHMVSKKDYHKAFDASKEIEE